MQSVKMVRLPLGGKVIRVTTRSLLTKYDLVAAAIQIKKEDQECDLTRSSLIFHVKRMLENRGLESLISVYNKATTEEIRESEKSVRNLFPSL